MLTLTVPTRNFNSLDINIVFVDDCNVPFPATSNPNFLVQSQNNMIRDSLAIPTPLGLTHD